MSAARTALRRLRPARSRAGDPGRPAHAHRLVSCAAVCHTATGYLCDHPRGLGPYRQLMSDTYAAQHLGPATPVLTGAFSLVGLYLWFERGSSGVDVAEAHTAMARTGTAWPRLVPPAAVGDLTVSSVEGRSSRGRRSRLGGRSRTGGATVWDAWPESDRGLIRELAIATIPAQHLRR